MSKTEHETGLITPWPHEPTRPICIRVFLNDDDTQYGVDLCATWGAEPPWGATTVIYENTWTECGECGHHDPKQIQHGTKWRLVSLQELDISDGVVGYYRKVQ